MAVFTPRPWKNYDGSSRCGHGFCAGACRVPADTGRSRARLCGLQACQQRQVIGNYRRPDVSLEVLEAAPGGTSQAVGALETRDAGLVPARKFRSRRYTQRLLTMSSIARPRFLWKATSATPLALALSRLSRVA